MIVTDKKFGMEKFLVEELDFLKKCVSKSWDGVILIDGVEGSAKTTLGGACCYYLDPKFCLDNVVFTPQQFSERVDRATKGDAILWDEFSLAGLSTDAMTKVQGEILKKITTIRKKGLYIVLVVSWFFELRKYFAVGRTRFLLHTTTPDGLTRGYMKYWGFDAKRKLYFKGRKNYEYVVKPTLRGRFVNTDGFFYDLEEYDKKKESAIKSIDFDGKKDTKWKKQRDTLVKVLVKDGYKQKAIGELIDVSQHLISGIINQEEEYPSKNGDVNV